MSTVCLCKVPSRLDSALSSVHLTTDQALLFQQEVAKIGSPSPQNLSFLQRWMMRPRMGNVYLLGPEGHIWENSQPSELLAIRPSISDNWFTRFSSTILVRWYHRIIGRFFRVRDVCLSLSCDTLLSHIKKPDSAAYHGNTVEYSQEGIGHLTVVIGTAVASLLPVASIIVLYFIVSMAIRLFFVALFTVLFSLGLSLLTNGRMVEIFSATSAYELEARTNKYSTRANLIIRFAAVLVVFVGSTGSTATP